MERILLTPRSLTTTAFDEPLAARLAASTKTGVALYWLGQAGFVIEAHGRRILIDPYLSDSLAEKCRGKRFSHERLMPAPVSLADLGRVDLVLVTHQHTDHMDPATLNPIAAANPECRFVAPRAVLNEAMNRIGVGAERIIGLDAGDSVRPLPECSVSAVRAAHETLERSPEGWHRFLGYVCDLGGTRLYHSGDTVLFEGLAEEVAPLRPSVALLPVNGRRAELLNAGIPGNLTLDEACALAARIGSQDLVAHHHGMFAFNTIDPARIDAMAARDDCVVHVHRARTSVEYRLSN